MMDTNLLFIPRGVEVDQVHMIDRVRIGAEVTVCCAKR